jgi:3-hydroxyisobutyrate dehydrogenase
MTNTKKIGFIGLGNMGNPMVKNLVKAGFEVTVYNRTKEKALALQAETEVKVADKPQDLAAEVDVIISMLSNDAAVKEVYTGNYGIFQSATTKPLILIDMSTVSPETTRALAATAADHGIDYLDAPVSGSVKPATDGQLVIMVGGKESAFKQVEQVFAALGKSATLLGESGSGNIAKLAINLFLAITIQGLSEAVLLASNNGIQPEALLPLINASAIGSGITKIKTDNIIQDNYQAAFALKLLRKDLGLAEQIGMQSPAGITVAQSFQQAMEMGFGEEDMVAIYKHLANKAAASE